MAAACYATRCRTHATDDILKYCPLWYARYRELPVGIPIDTWQDFTLWQYTDGQNGPGPQIVNGMDGQTAIVFAAPPTSFAPKS